MSNASYSRFATKSARPLQRRGDRPVPDGSSAGSPPGNDAEPRPEATVSRASEQTAVQRECARGIRLCGWRRLVRSPWAWSLGLHLGLVGIGLAGVLPAMLSGPQKGATTRVEISHATAEDVEPEPAPPETPPVMELPPVPTPIDTPEQEPSMEESLRDLEDLEDLEESEDSPLRPSEAAWEPLVRQDHFRRVARKPAPTPPADDLPPTSAPATSPPPPKVHPRAPGHAPARPTRKVASGTSATRPIRWSAPPPHRDIRRLRGPVKVVLMVHVDASGRIGRVDVHTSSGVRSLDEHARSWVARQWRYPPHSTAFRTLVPCHFEP